MYILKLTPHRGRAPLSGKLWRAQYNREDGKFGMADISLWRGRIYLNRGDKKPGACKAPVWPWTELYQTPPPLWGGFPLWRGENSLSEGKKDAGRDRARAGNLKSTWLREFGLSFFWEWLHLCTFQLLWSAEGSRGQHERSAAPPGVRGSHFGDASHRRRRRSRHKCQSHQRLHLERR